MISNVRLSFCKFLQNFKGLTEKYFLNQLKIALFLEAAVHFIENGFHSLNKFKHLGM